MAFNELKLVANLNLEKECQYCKKSFKFSNTLKKHEETCFKKKKNRIVDNQVKKLKCRMCPKLRLTSEEQYLYHITEVHKGKDRDYVMCSECGKQFKTRGELTHHNKSKCGTLKLYACKICGQELMTAGSLHNHMLLHTGQRSCMCGYCGKLFLTPGQLKVHERAHTQEKAFICTVCGKGFCHRQSLITHSTLHTGIKPYQCDSCGNSFSCVGNLIKHRKMHAETCGLTPLTTHRVNNPTTKMKIKVNTPKSSKLKKIKKEKEVRKKIEAYKQQLNADDNLVCNEVTDHCFALEKIVIQDKNDSDTINTSTQIHNCHTPIKNEEKELIILPPNNITNTDYKDAETFFREYTFVESTDTQYGTTSKKVEPVAEETAGRCSYVPNNNFNAVLKADLNTTSISLAKDDRVEENQLNTSSLIGCSKEVQPNNTEYTATDETRHNINTQPNEHIQNSHDKQPVIKKLKKEKHTYSHVSITNEDIEEYMKNITPESRHTVCKYCNKSYSNVRWLLRHERSHKQNCGNDASLPSHKCACCKLSFHTKEECKNHQKLIHTDLLTCYSCEKLFSNLDSLRSHEKIFHKGVPRKVYTYICKRCGLQFKQKMYLIHHEQNNCGTNPTFSCHICGKGFSTIHTCRSHMRIHDPKKRFLCKFCGKSFRWKGQLKIHERSHTGEKPFTCLYCPKAFAYRESLITHSSLHTGIKPHLCRACGSRFSCIGNLIKHRATHASSCGVWYSKNPSAQ